MTKKAEGLSLRSGNGYLHLSAVVPAGMESSEPCPPGGQSMWRDAPCTHLHLEISPACSTTDSLKKASEEKEKTQLQITKQF